MKALAPEPPLHELADDGRQAAKSLLQQQRRRQRFIEANRLSLQEVTDHIAWDFDPGPEYD